MGGVRKGPHISGIAFACRVRDCCSAPAAAPRGRRAPLRIWVDASPDRHRRRRESNSLIASFPNYIDPALVNITEGLTATYDTYVPLLTYAHAKAKPGAQVIPGLARAMPGVSADGRTYTLFLRPGLGYSDGTRVRASDFTFTVERMFRLNASDSVFFDDIVGAQLSPSQDGGISGIEPTTRPAKSSSTWSSRAAPSRTSSGCDRRPGPEGHAGGDLSANPPPATGPYVIASSKPGRGWTYERNPRWAPNNAALLPQIPSGHVDRISVAVVRNGSTEVNGVENGEYDWMQIQPPTDRYN